MTEPDQFDQFYKDVRTRLLLLTYCLTGDLPSARAAVRDGFVVAWHHWRKVSRLDDPEAWVRERACRDAQRRHTAKLWHREKGLDPEVKATLDALGGLSMTQRRVLLLTELTTTSLTEMAREAGLPRADAERELQAASAAFALQREVPSPQVRTVLESVRDHVEDTRWPRPSILRRAGANRRRTHTVLGVAATVAALVVSGTLLSESGGARPTLPGERVGTMGGQPADQRVDLPEDAMVTADQVDLAAPGHAWSVVPADADGAAEAPATAPCQQGRYASPRPVAALVRSFEPGSGKARRRTTAVQATEASATERAARRGYATALRWYAGCTDDRAQLISTREVEGVGDEAALVVLHSWADGPDSTIVAGVARTGRFTTLTVRQSDDPQPKGAPWARLLGQAVAGLCDLEGAGECTSTPTTRATALVPVSPTRGMLDVVDLPPITGITRPWVAAPANQPRTNFASTRCDETDFTRTYAGSPVTRAATGSFLILGAKLPDEFGLTETVGALPAKAARVLVEEVRSKLARCEDKVFGTTVRRTSNLSTRDRDLTVWHVTIELSDDRSVTTPMAILRAGTAVAQLGFVPGRDATMAEGRFEALARRALERLANLPAPAR